MVRKLLKSLYDICSSRRLAVGLMVYAAFLVFVATIAQTQIGIETAKSKFFESFFCLAEFSAVKVPLIGGATVGALAVVNLLASGWRYARGGVYGFGMSIAHMALVLLILSGALQYFMRSEGSVMLTEGAESDTVALRNGAKIKIPFKIKLVKFDAEYWNGSSTPKSFSSKLEFLRDGSAVPKTAAMNSPVSFGGWTFYQMSYADNGRTSVLSAVRNPARLLPWLAVGATFFGMVLMFLPRMFAGNGGGNEK